MLLADYWFVVVFLVLGLEIFFVFFLFFIFLVFLFFLLIVFLARHFSGLGNLCFLALLRTGGRLRVGRSDSLGTHIAAVGLRR